MRPNKAVERPIRSNRIGKRSGASQLTTGRRRPSARPHGRWTANLTRARQRSPMPDQLRFGITVMRVRILSCALSVALACAAWAAPASAQKTLRAVMNSDLKIIDPIWTTAYISRNHGYMVYDTLFALDADGVIRPQMVDTHTVSADGLVYTFTLREGLFFHDGAPVTSDDCIASIKRWAARDTLGQKLMTFIASMDAVNTRTFTIKLKEPTGLVLPGLAKPSSNGLFIMPKRVADTDPNTQIKDATGSGPFVFKMDEWKPGDIAVYVKFDRYKPRAEPPSGLAGGKVVKIDRIEWKAIGDNQTIVNALLAGEIDYVEQPAWDLLPLVKKDANVRIFDFNPLGVQYAFRLNWLHKPFDNPKLRAAVWHALNQKDFLDAGPGDPAYYTLCKSYFPCGSPLANEAPMAGLLSSDMAKAQALVREGGYDGTPIVLLRSTDTISIANLPIVAASLLEKAGFKVEVHASDWQTMVARRTKREAPAQGGWNAIVSAFGALDIANPVTTGFLNATCDKALFGWPCDPDLESLRNQFATATDPLQQKEIADKVQARAIEMTTHIPLGQYKQPAAVRNSVQGLILAWVPIFWNAEIK
jgi:peptide/nickel transport system substrate-binding protein